MQIVARLSEYLLTQLRVAVARDHAVRAVPTWEELESAFAGHVVDVLVLEPTPLAPDELPPLLRLLARHPSVPVIIYTSVTPAAMRVTVELAARGVHHVVFRGIDDAPGRLRALMRDLADAAWRSTLWPWVQARVARGPAPIERAARELFDAPHRFHDVIDLADAAALTRRTVERWLARVGIGSAKLLVVGARVERAHHLLRSSGADVAAVATRLGYTSPRLFARHVMLATGRPPTALRYALSADELQARLTAAIESGESALRLMRSGKGRAPFTAPEDRAAG